MELVVDKNKRTGLIGTAIFHGALLLLFLFVGLKYMVPPPEEQGITINFGTSDDGKGNEQPLEPVETEDEQQEDTEQPTSTDVPTESVEEVITQDVEEAPKIKSEKTTEEVKKEPEKVEPQPSQKLTNLVDKLKKKSGSTNASEGETGKPGDQGRTDGDPNSKNRVGRGMGNGIGFSLAGRSPRVTPKITDDSQEEGTVVVDIVVDRQGNVVRASAGARGSTTTSPHLYKKAVQAAKQAKFNVSREAAIEQKGTMTFIFKLN